MSNLRTNRVVSGLGRWAILLVFLVAVMGATSARSEALIERGSYLVNTILACGNCHTPKSADGVPIAQRELSGGLSFTTPAFNATASNITPDRETGIGTWTDAEIKRALTEGARPNHGRLANVPLAAVMPVSFYKALLPRDLDAIVAYLRSVKPVRNAVPDPLYKQASKHDHYPDAEAGFTEAMLKDWVRRGAYLVTIGHCMECHSTRVGPVSDYQNGFGKGGRQFGPKLVQGFPAAWKSSTAPNITSHPKSGIGSWTNEEIKRAITKGISRDGRRLEPPMGFAWYAGMNEPDLAAIVAWLRTVPPLE